MNAVIQKIIGWIEVWGLLIPISVILIRKHFPAYIKSLKVFLFFGFFLYLVIDLIFDFKKPYHFPGWLQSNNFIYNIISILRLTCFSMFFIRLDQAFATTLKKILPLLFIFFAIINFIFFENFFNYYFLSNRLLAVECSILLLYCLQYYFYIFLKDDKQDPLITLPSFWIVTGLAIFIVISLPIYIFYRQLVMQNKTFGIDIWQVQNIAYLIFCIFMAIGLYKTKP